jgi:hypothetical protein
VAEELRTAGEVTGIAPCLAVARPGQRRPFARSSAAMELAEALVDGVENLLAQVGKVALQDLVENSWLNSASSANAVGVRAAAGVELEVLITASRTTSDRDTPRVLDRESRSSTTNFGSETDWRKNC